jgi:diguanylate cyclase (GGDEF)-like protein
MLITCACGEDAVSLVERIRLNIDQMTVTLDGKSITVTISAGIAAVPCGAGIDTAISQADQALYAAKDQGRNRTVFYEGEMG